MSEHAKDTLDGRALAGALEALRPERAAFEQGVRRRIAEGEERERERAAEIERSPFLRAAAGLLPATLLPKGIAPATLAAWSPRSLLLLVVWPALTLAMLLLYLTLAFGTLGWDEPRAMRRQRESLQAWWRMHARAVLLTVGLIAPVFWLSPAGGVLALLLVSTGVLALLLARLRATGFGTRAQVGRNCAAFLLWPVLLLVRETFGAPWMRFFADRSMAGWSLALLGTGLVACAFLSLAAVHRTPWSWLVRSSGVEAAIGLAALWMLGFLALGGTVYLVAGASLREALIPDEPRLLLDAALLLAYGLLSALCVAATLRTPRAEP